MSPRSDRIDCKRSRELSVDRIRIMGAFGVLMPRIKRKKWKYLFYALPPVCGLFLASNGIRYIQRSHFYRDLGPGYNLTIYLRKPHELVTETKTAIFHKEILTKIFLFCPKYVILLSTSHRKHFGTNYYTFRFARPLPISKNKAFRYRWQTFSGEWPSLMKSYLIDIVRWIFVSHARERALQFTIFFVEKRVRRKARVLSALPPIFCNRAQKETWGDYVYKSRISTVS